MGRVAQGQFGRRDPFVGMTSRGEISLPRHFATLQSFGGVQGVQISHQLPVPVPLLLL